jgi:hypothetical protein
MSRKSTSCDSLLVYYARSKRLLPNLIQLMRTRIARIVKRRFRFDPDINLILKLPYNPHAQSHNMTAVIKGVVDNLDLPNIFKCHLKSTTRAVETRRKNIKDLLINNRAFCKTADFDAAPPECTCQQIRDILDIPDTPGLHVAVRTADLTQFPLLCTNLTNVLPVSTKAYRQEVLTAVADTLSARKSALAYHGTTSDGRGNLIFNKSNVVIQRAGKTLATVSIKRFKRWYAEYETCRTTRPLQFQKYGATNFLSDIIKLCDRYKKWLHSNHWIVPARIYTSMHKHLNTVTEYFASPFDFNLTHPNYFSAFPEDALFGASGSAFSTKWKGIGVANPHYHIKDISKALRWALHAAKSETEPTGTMFIIPIWEKYGHVEGYSDILNARETYTTMITPENDFRFIPPDQAMFGCDMNTLQPHRKPPGAGFKVGLFYIANKAAVEGASFTAMTAELMTVFRDLKMHPTIPHGEWTQGTTTVNNTNAHMRQNSDWRKMLKRLRKREKRNHPEWEPRARTPKDVSIADFRITYLEKLLDTPIRPLVDEYLNTMINTSRPELELQYPKDILDAVPGTMSLCRELRRCAVISEVDKNSSCGLIQCKRWAFNQYKATFVDDTTHYDKILTSEKQIMTSWKDTFLRERWAKFGFFKTDSSLPYGYSMPKNKDINKNRPIVSYAVHPMKKMLNRAGRALQTILASIDPSQHFTLWKTLDFTTEIKLDVDAILDSYPDVVAYAGDIKNMFTELPHDEIIKAVTWAIEQMSSRRKHVSVSKTGRGGARIGIPYCEDDSQVRMSFEDLMAIVKFDLDNCYFKSGTQTLKQNIGIPMGSPLSPILALIICAYYEAKHKKMINDVYTLRGKRYVDDALFLTGADLSIPGDLAVAQHRLLLASKSYHKNLVLEPETDHTDFNMLESRVLFKPNQYGSMSYNHKNAKFFSGEQTSRLLKFQNFWSFTNSRAKRGVIMSTFMRVRRSSSTDELALPPLLTLCTELTYLGYPKGFILKVISALNRKMHRDQCSIWNTLRSKLHSVTPLC